MNSNQKKILDTIESETKQYIENISSDIRKKKSQFFTSYEIATKMVKMIDWNKYESTSDIKMLEPSAGFGMLVFAFVIELIKKTKIKNIEIVLYENDDNICESLYKVIELIKEYLKSNACILKYTIINKDFILANKCSWNSEKVPHEDKFNLILSNPPYKKIKRNDDKASVMSNIITDQPNLYHLFIALSLKLLNSGGQYITLTPRNYLVGKYTYKLRLWIFDNFSIANLHSFDSRNLFKEVNQEVIITRFVNWKQDKIKISHNSSSKFITSINELILDRDKMMILLPINKEELSIVTNLRNKGEKLAEIGIKSSVGPIVQFRNTKYLSKDKTDFFNVPFLIPSDLKDNYILFDNRTERYKYISNEVKSRLIKNINGVLLRKVTAKDDKETIVGAVLKKEYFKTEMIGIDSNLIFFQGINREMSIEECYGLYAFLVSEYFSRYYLSINATHTINMFELSSMYFPKTVQLINIGKKVILEKNLEKDYINELINMCFNM